MSIKEIDEKVRELHRELTEKAIKNKCYLIGNVSPENSEVVDKCLDLYFKLREENKPQQLELEF